MMKQTATNEVMIGKDRSRTKGRLTRTEAGAGQTNKQRHGD